MFGSFLLGSGSFPSLDIIIIIIDAEIKVTLSQ